MRERERIEHIPYNSWKYDGWIHATEGDVIDYTWIERDIRELSDRFNIVEVGYDPWSCTQTALRIRDDIGIPVVPVRQSFMSLSEPTKEFERLIVSRKLAHNGNACLTWQANNVTIRHDPAGNIKPEKGSVHKQKIDGIIASIIALSRASLSDGGSIYEEDGLLVL